jgi:hypothetical protein
MKAGRYVIRAGHRFNAIAVQVGVRQIGTEKDGLANAQCERVQQKRRKAADIGRVLLGQTKQQLGQI